MDETGLMIESESVRISDIFADIDDYRVTGEVGVQVTSLCYRSDQCSPGSLFFCVPGFQRDGHDFAVDAVSKGAVALCVERHLDLPVTQVVVGSVREAMGVASSIFYGRPSNGLVTVGITGTNGKTTSAFLMAHILDAAGLRSGLMGTVERRIGGARLSAGRTTPEAIDIQHDLALMRDAGDSAVVMEVSSHALDLGRVRGVDFRAVAFTNLTQDHLDFHGDLESYYLAKRRLFVDKEFTEARPVAVVNIDDEYGRRLASECDPNDLLTLSTTGMSWAGGRADLEMSRYSMGPAGTVGTLVLRGSALRYLRSVHDAHEGAGDEVRCGLRSTLVGGFNVANTLTAVSLGLGLGLDLDEMLGAVANFPGVPGRMERIEAGQDLSVLVDYAHTPDSVENVLRTARGITTGRLVAVLGCGGDRDKGKRPLMGRAAEELADVVIVTSDNPRSERPEAIIADILAGLERPAAAVVQPDRSAAIHIAIRGASPGDVVMILGKGHESGQEFADGTVPFDDREVARAAVRLMGRESS